MNKVIISAFAASLLFGFSQVGEAKEHKGPKADRGSSYSSQGAHNRGGNRAATRSDRNHRADSNRSSGRDRNRHSARDRNRHRADSRSRGARHHDRRDRHYGSRDRYRDDDRHHARHRKHYRARYRNHYRPRYKHYHPRTYPVNVYYLGQDWHYYGGYYHPFPRQHIHTRYCNHRYWEPLAVGVILGTVLGW